MKHRKSIKYILDSLPIALAEEMEGLQTKLACTTAYAKKCLDRVAKLKAENKKLKAERDAFQAQAGARKREIFLLKAKR